MPSPNAHGRVTNGVGRLNFMSGDYHLSRDDGTRLALRQPPDAAPRVDRVENWPAGIPNKTQVGDMGIDGRIYPASSSPEKKTKATGHLDFMDVWYSVQVKQKDKAGRPEL